MAPPGAFADAAFAWMAPSNSARCSTVNGDVLIVVMELVASTKSTLMRPMIDFKLLTWLVLISSRMAGGVPAVLDIVIYATEASMDDFNMTMGNVGANYDRSA